MRQMVALVNFSPLSLNAARYAADLARSMQTELHLYHVVELPTSAGELPLTDHAFQQMLESAAECLAKLWKELVKRTEGEVNIYTHIETGTVEASIEDFCMRKKPVLVVLGATGHTLEAAFTGGHAGAAMRRLPYPLIVVPEGASFAQFTRILLACDQEDVSGGVSVADTLLKEFSGLFGSSFDVVHVETAQQRQNTEKLLDSSLWKESIRSLDPEVHFVQKDKVEEGIGKYMLEHPADLLLVFPKRHHFLEFHRSHARKLALTSRVPVMSIHA